MPLSDLTINGLYVILFVRDSPPDENDFHWGLYFHTHPDNGGTKYHIQGQRNGWLPDHGPTAGVFKSSLLVGLFEIAKIRAY